MTRSRLLFACGLLATVALAAGCGQKTEPTPGAGPVPNPAPNPKPANPTKEDETAAKAEALKRLKQTGVAVHNYESVNGCFPAGIVGPKGELGLSWRVQLLPYLEEGDLFNEFKTNEPWDSEHNKKLLAK